MPVDRSDELDRVKKWYADREESRIWGEQRVDEGLNPTEEHLLQKYFSPPGRVLNVGCGGGREALALHEKGFEVVGADLCESFVETARVNAQKRSAPILFVVADVRDLPFSDEEFDCVVMVGQLIGQVPGRANRIKALREVKRVLTRAGILLCSTNAIELSWKYRLYFLVANAKRKLYNPHGLAPNDAFVFRTGGKYNFLRSKAERPLYHWYTRREFQRDLDEAGFGLLESVRRWEFEAGGGAGKKLLGGETYYVAIKD